MKKLLVIVLLLCFTSIAHAAPVQTIISTTARRYAPPSFYGIQMVLQLPVGVTPHFDPTAPGQNLIDPTSITSLNTLNLSTNTLISAEYQPSSSSSVGDTVTIALSNSNGIGYGILMDVLCDFKTDFVPTYSSSGNVNNVSFKIASVTLFDANGATIPSKYISVSINNTYVWK